MPDKYDPYRDALVVETATVWPEELAAVPEDRREKIAARLHADPQRAAHLDYVRLHAGFCRRITVTADDMARVQAEPGDS
jgi:hypothetical protein